LNHFPHVFYPNILGEANWTARNSGEGGEMGSFLLYTTAVTRLLAGRPG